jgi:hypothetical protein
MSDSAGPRNTVKGVYEMLWDCAFCDARELLGRTHRFCPGCGAPQDPAKRYFPPEGKETVASAAWDGADRTCAACQTATGAKSKHCAHCGAPLDGAKEVARVQAPSPPKPPVPPPPPPKKESSWFALTVGGLLLLTCLSVGLVNSMAGNTGGGGGSAVASTVEARVVAHEWVRELDVEGLVDQDVTAWCDEVAPSATVTARVKANRGTQKVADGETCVMKNVDRGDGTFEKREDCVPKFRDEPVLADRCTVKENGWKVVRTEKGTGDVAAPPAWPSPKLVEGQERAAARRESFGLVLAVPGRQVRCTMQGEQAWRAAKDGEVKLLPRMVPMDGRPCSF